MLEALLATIILAGCAIYIIGVGKIRAIPKPVEEKKPKTERQYGTWVPEDFSYPAIEAWNDFDVNSVNPIPYRPFRCQTSSSIEWIE